MGARHTALSFVGGVDQPGIWSRQLSALEVQEIYNAGATTNLYDIPGVSTGLLSTWNMGDGDIYPVVLDQVGSVNGTMVNMDSSFSTDVP
jgi:hypothetical protein